MDCIRNGRIAAESMKQRTVQVTALTQQKQRLEDRLEKMYLDELDGVLSEEEYARLSKKFRSEATDLKFKLEQTEGKTRSILTVVSVYSNSRKRPPVFTLHKFRLKNEDCLIRCTRTPLGQVENWLQTSGNHLI